MTSYYAASDNEIVLRMNPAKDRQFCHNLRKYLREYNEITGIHGLRYLTEKRSRVEKIIWAVLLLVSLAGCIYMICEIFIKYRNSPVVVSFATKETLIQEIPFPAVTICPEAPCSQDKFNYTDLYRKFLRNETMSEDILQKLAYMRLRCPSFDEDKIQNISKYNYVDNNFYNFMNESKPTPRICFYMHGSDRKCSGIFVPVITDEGICYSFNILDRQEVFEKHVVHYDNHYQVQNNSQYFDGESGYVKGAGINVYPKRATMSGIENSFAVFAVSLLRDVENNMCSQLIQGLKVSIHNPMDMPRLSKHFLLIPRNKIVFVAVQPELITTSDTVRNFSPEKRKCYLKNERPLRDFKVYTQSNCFVECLTNYTLKLCGCVSFDMPRSKETAVCGAGKAKCVNEAESKLGLKEFESKISENVKDSCDCRPLCTELRYNAEITVGNFDTNVLAEQMETMSDEEQYIFSGLMVYFKNEQFLALERNELYGISDLISNFGGLLGLFTGFSLISLFEIIYFLTVRIFYNERLYGMWSGPPD